MRNGVASVAMVCVLGGTVACCTDEKLVERSSPDGKIVATVIQSNCGATTPYSVYIHLRRRGSIPNPFGGTYVFAQEGSTSVTLQWTGARELEASISHVGEPLRMIERWEDVTIRFTNRPGLMPDGTEDRLAPAR
jgi:hypothetical protein